MIMLVVVAAVGAFIVYSIIDSGRRHANWSRWPSVAAELLERRDGMPEMRPVDFRVRYQVSGQTYERFLPPAGELGRRGSTIEIRYNPADPAEALALPPTLPTRALAYSIGAIFAVFFFIFAFIVFA